jgi:hypothetical protein
MNEPHDVPDIDKWADTVQAAVTAIRNAGAKTQLILIPGNDWTSAQAMPTKSGPALLKVANPGGGTEGIVFDVHSMVFSLSFFYFLCVKDGKKLMITGRIPRLGQLGHAHRVRDG